MPDNVKARAALASHSSTYNIQVEPMLAESVVSRLPKVSLSEYGWVFGATNRRSAREFCGLTKWLISFSGTIITSYVFYESIISAIFITLLVTLDNK